jgi:SAM-dependent methyltransferase
MSSATNSRDWKRYYEKTGDRAPRRTLLIALDLFDRDARVRRRAVDLGCGSGRDTIELLRRGWQVLAIDAEADAIEALRNRTDLPAQARLETRLGRFEDLSWPPADLVNSSFALPLCAPADFARLWRRIVESLSPGGRFAGQFYGERDGWAGDPSLTHLSRKDAEALLEELEVECFDEEEEDSVTPRGKPKHWHIFHVVARKP